MPTSFISRVQCFIEGLQFSLYAHGVVVPGTLGPIQVPRAIIAEVNTEEGIVEMLFGEWKLI